MGSIRLTAHRPGAGILAMAAVAGVVSVAPHARAGEYQWTHVPPPPPAPMPSYTDPANWTPAGVPGAADTAVFSLGTDDWIDVDVPSSVTHQQVKVIDNAMNLHLGGGATTMTLTGAGNTALQVGAGTSTYAGSADFNLNGGQLATPNGGITVSAYFDNINRVGGAALDLDETALATQGDVVLGTSGGDGSLFFWGAPGAGTNGTIGGNLVAGNGGYGSADLFERYRLNVAGDLVVAAAGPHEGYVATELGTETTDIAAYDTGITVGGNVHVGGTAAGGSSGGEGWLLIYSHSYIRSAGDWVFHDAGWADIWDHGHGAARNVTLGTDAYISVDSSSRLDVANDLLLNPGSALYVSYGSLVTVGGTLAVADGATLYVSEDSRVDAGISNAGAFEVDGAPTVRSLANADTALLQFGIDSLTEFDRLTALQTIALDGVLELTFAEEFTPTEGMSFDLFDAVAITGGFDQITFDRDLGLGAVFDPATGVVTLVPEPGVLAMAGVGAMLAVARPRRRRRRA